MTFKSATWYPIAAVLSALNLVGAGFAVGQAEPVHATIHVAVAAAFALWARRLRQRPDGNGVLDRLEALESLEGEVSTLRQELGEMQERLDFAERVLAQAPETRRVGPEG